MGELVRWAVDRKVLYWLSLVPLDGTEEARNKMLENQGKWWATTLADGDAFVCWNVLHGDLDEARQFIQRTKSRAESYPG